MKPLGGRERYAWLGGRRASRWMVAVAMAVQIVGCAELPRWRREPPVTGELVLDQLVVHSAQPIAADHRLLRELLQLRQDVATTLSLPTSDEPIHVYLFDDAREFSQFARQEFPEVAQRRALFVETDTRLSVYAHWGDRVAEDLRHEVSHGYLHAVAPGIPLWLDEGLAEFFEPPRNHGGLNQAHLVHLREALERGDWQPDLARLERLGAIGDMTQLDYAESWAWVHFMLKSDSRRRQLLVDYLQTLHRGELPEPLPVVIRQLHTQPEPLLVDHLRALPSG